MGCIPNILFYTAIARFPPDMRLTGAKECPSLVAFSRGGVAVSATGLLKADRRKFTRFTHVTVAEGTTYATSETQLFCDATRALIGFECVNALSRNFSEAGRIRGGLASPPCLCFFGDLSCARFARGFRGIISSLLDRLTRLITPQADRLRHRPTRF